jgi:DNA replication protein DnaC
MITTNLAFSEWDVLFKVKMLASAAIDRIVHHSQVFKFEKSTSFRAEAAKKKLIKKK